MPSTIKVEIKRQSTPDAPAITEKFEIPYRPGMNITSLLGEIALNPVDVSGKPTTPITYDSNCLEEICGSCAMLINGKATMACSALVDKLTGPNKDQTITLAPLSKFPVIRDLAGDGGIQECGFAQNCVQACPKGLPLTEAISDMGRDVFIQQVKDLFA